MIRGVKIGPSPAWLRKRLETVGIASINNVVDVTNYVLMECGQPLHAFDFDRLHGRRIIVRAARPGEKLIAINQRTYDLQPGMCVIADADRPVALGGVMGGLETEIGPTAKNILIEAANFKPLVDPQHGPQTGPAQRFVVSLRARHRHCPARLGQPPVLPVDPRAGRGRAAGNGGLRGRSPRTRAPANRAAVRPHPQDPGDRRAAGRSGPHPRVAGDRAARNAIEWQMRIRPPDLAPRHQPRDRSDRRGRADSRLRQNSARRDRSAHRQCQDGPRPGGRINPFGAHLRRFLRSASRCRSSAKRWQICSSPAGRFPG